MNSSKLDTYIRFGLLIIAFSSLLSPVIITFINNRYNYKIRNLEINSAIKQEVLKNFALSVNMEYVSKSFRAKFRQDLNLLYVYFNVDDNLINKILTYNYKDTDDFQCDITKLMKKLSKQIKYK